MKALIFGASGGLAESIAQAMLARAWKVDLVTREANRDLVVSKFESDASQSRVRVFAVPHSYSSFVALEPADAYFFTQALFAPAPLTAVKEADIAVEFAVGLVDVIQLTGKLLSSHPATLDERRDYCFIGSTSAYAGFRNTSVYCAVKHGLLGFVRAMNDEYAHTNTRFWLFSMGTMNTAMGRRLTEQDPESFLDPSDVAERIATAICSPSNIFEPEVILRRRTIRYLEP